MDVMDFRWKYACWWILDGFWMVFGWLKIDFDGFWMYVWILFGWIWDGLGQISFDGCFGWILEGSWMDFHAFWMDFCWFLDRFWWILDGFLRFGWIVKGSRVWLILAGFRLSTVSRIHVCTLSFQVYISSISIRSSSLSSRPYLGCTRASYLLRCISPAYLPGSPACYLATVPRMHMRILSAQPCIYIYIYIPHTY